MSVSGNEEAGVKPVALLSSFNVAGVPIKKRRFIRPLLPPLEEQSPQPVQDDVLQQEHLSPSLESGPLDAGASEFSLQPSDAIETSVPEETKNNSAVSVELSGSGKVEAEESSGSGHSHSGQSSFDIAGVPIKKRSFITHSSSPEEQSSQPMQEDVPQEEQCSPSRESDPLIAGTSEISLKIPDAIETSVLEETKNNSAISVEISGSGKVEAKDSSGFRHSHSSGMPENNTKLTAVERSADMLLSSQESGLKSILIDTLKLQPIKEMNDPQKEESKFDIPNVYGNPKLSLIQEKHPAFALKDHANHGDGGIGENFESVSLKLSLSNEKSSPQKKAEDVQLNTHRSNWDLNTTMDAWEDSGTDTAKEVATVGEMHDIKPSISSVGFGGTFIATKGQLLHERDCGSGMGSSTVSKPSKNSNKEGSLSLHLLPSVPSLNISQEPSSSTTKKYFPGSASNVTLPGGLFSIGNDNLVRSGIVKSEPLDDSLRHDLRGVTTDPTALLNSKVVKQEFPENLGPEMLNSRNISPVNLSNYKIVKSEPFHEGNSETFTKVAESSVQFDKLLQDQHSGGPPACSTSELQRLDASALGGCKSMDEPVEFQDMINKPTGSNELSINAPDHLENDSGAEGGHLGKELPKTESESLGLISPAIPSLCGDQVGTESVVISMTDAVTVVDNNANSAKKSKMTSINEEVPQAHGHNKEVSTSDEEKVNLSGDMLEEDFYESECESDGNSVPMDIEEDGRRRDDFKDAGVQGQGLNAIVEGPISDMHEDCSINCANNNTLSSVKLQHAPEVHAHTGSDVVNQCVGGTAFEQTIIEEALQGASVEDSLAVGRPCSGSEEDQTSKTNQREPLDASVEKVVLKDQRTDQSCNQANSGGQESSLTIAQDLDDNIKLCDMENNYSALPNVEVPLGNDASKDPSNGAQRSRIINLSRGSSEATPGKVRSLSSDTLTSYGVRERLPDGPLEGDRPYPRGRNDFYRDSFHRFSRERHQDHRTYRPNFTHGRGRLPGRSDSLHVDRSYEHSFPPELNDCLSDYGVPKNKYVAAAVATVAASEADVKFADHDVGPDGQSVGAGHGRRKVADDESESFHHVPLRRRLHGGRDGPASHGVQMARRFPRTIGEDGAEVVGLRRTDRLTRGTSNDGGERTFSCNQSSYEESGSHFIQGARNFSSVQRRTVPHSRSPGSWLSSKKRSPDAFDGPADLPHRRSPPIYRMNRMRSPDHHGFPPEMTARRHASPTFLTRCNDLRESDPGRDHSHPRSMLSNRSPSGRVVFRNNRRFGIGDPRERADGDELLSGSMRSGRFQEMSDGDVEERRGFGERRGPFRSFRPPFNVADGENYHHGNEDRPLRFFAEGDQQFHERVNLRERSFERGIKIRPGNAPRRPRGIEDQEGNYRHTGQGMYEDELENMSQLKRKRF